MKQDTDSPAGRAQAGEAMLDSRVQTFVICAIGLALAAGPVGFELGAYGTMFFTRIYTSWFLVTAALIAMAVVPGEQLPFAKNRLLFLLVPSVWMLVRLLVPIHNAGEAMYPPLFVLGMVSYLLCLPYAAFLIIRLVKPEFLELPGRKPKAGLVLILLLFLGLGYLMGKSHARLLTCEDFTLSGNAAPVDCTPRRN